MTTQADHLDAFVTRLQDKSLDFQAKHSIFTELCDTLDTYIGANEYDNFLKKLLNILFEYLQEVPVSFVSNTPEQKLRYLILDIIMRLPANDIYQQYVFDVYDVLINVIKDDNEENGICCTKIIISLHKSYKNYLSSKVEDYLSLLISIYKNMPQVVQENFGAGVSTAPTTRTRKQSAAQATVDEDTKNLLKATHSLKVAAECPATLVSLYNIYSNLITSTVPEFLPPVLDLMSLQADDQRKEHEKYKRKREILTHVSPNISNKSLYCDFILCQIKAAFFLAFVLIKKIDTSSLEDRMSEIPDILIRLLQDCPPESSSLRKELLYAIRHTLTTDLRKLYASKFEILFNEKVLLGDGLTAHETLRPLAYTIVADFVHLNDEISPAQIWKAVETFCDHLKDNSLTQNVYIMSAKLMLNLVDRINKLENKKESRQMFLVMIDAFGKRFSAVNNQFDDIMIQHEEYTKNKSSNTQKLVELESRAQELTGEAANGVKPLKEIKAYADLESSTNEVNQSSDAMDIDDDFENNNYFSFETIEKSLPIQVSQPVSQDPLESTRYMFKMFMTFLRSIFMAMKSSDPDVPSDYTIQSWQEVARINTLDELSIFKRLFSESIDCLKFFQSSKLPQLRASMKQAYEAGGSSHAITSCKEEKDLMELLAALFIQLEPASFNEVLESEMPHLFNAILENPALLHVPQYFFANEMTTSNFFSILIVFCINKLPELGDLDIVKANVLNRLFKFCFMSVNLFPNHNESVLLPHLNKLILDSLEYSTTAKDPLVYFYLIRTLFRAIGGGKFEAMYKEIFSILQVLLECLSKLFTNSRRQIEKDVFADLCLTIPVRLSVLVPHLHHLMRPIVHALNSTPDLVTQGLRTLELCVDNMTQEFIDPIIEPVIEDIMKALWKHLRPVPYSHMHSHTALRILGKMGGRNRNFIKLHHDLSSQTVTDQELLGMFKIEGIPNEVPVSMTAAISSALTALTTTRPKIHYRVSAFKYLTSILKLFINTSELPEDYEIKVQQAVSFITNQASDPLEETTPLEAANVLDDDRFTRQEELLVELLKALFFSVSLDDVKEEAEILIDGICKHYVLLCLTRTITDHYNLSKPFNVNNHEGSKHLSEDTLFEAIVYVLSHYNPTVREAGKKAVKNIFNVCLQIFGSMNDVLKFMSIKKLCSTFIHCCFKDAYYDKLSGCIGLQVMINELNIPYDYFGIRQVEISRAMFFVLRDTPSDVPSEVCKIAKSLILDILRNCNKEVTKDMIYQQPFQSLISQIVYDLSNYNKMARETAQEALIVLSEITSVPISDMISPSKSVLLAPIFGKPLRALPFHMQIGNIDAITFCLQLDGSFLEFNDELNRLLSEALALVDADDESLISVNKITEHKSAEQVINLRIVCIELLSLALTKQEFSNSSVRIRILSVFFKTLCSSSIRIIEAAYKGLSKVLSNNTKLPKELLQNGLRPMLMNLSDYKKLTVSGLEALIKLLELLISYFKVEIGRKLLDHLMAWAQPSTLQRLSKQKLESNHTIQIIAGILKIFYMLPDQAFTYMKELMDTLLYLENNLRRHNTSPFRKPVSLFLNRFNEKAIEFFKENFKSREYGTRFADFVSLDESPKLREALKDNLQDFMEMLCNETDNGVKFIMFANMVDLIYSIGSNDPEWVQNSSEIFKTVFKISIDCIEYKANAPLDSNIHFQLRESIEKVQGMYISILKSAEDRPDAVITFINYLTSNDIAFAHSVDKFLFTDVVNSKDVKLTQKFLDTSIKSLGDDTYDNITNIQLLKKIVIPILYVNAKNVGRDTDLSFVDGKPAKWISSLGESVWNNVEEQITDESYESDTFRVELMQLTSLMVEHYPDVVSDWKKEIIKFNWNNISLEDTITKQVAYVSIAYCIKNFEIPAKLVMPVFVALLKANQNEVKSLVRQSLDLVAPKLNERLGTDSEWLSWTRRVLSEHGYVVTQVLNVYQLIVQHSDLFYASRDQFIPNIITAMGKLTVLNNSMTENQMLAMQLAELILNWEARSKKEISDMPADPDAMDVDSEENKFVSTVPNGQKETCITFLIRYICLSHQRASENELSRKALVILHILLSPGFWPDVGVKLVFLEKMLAAPDSKADNMLTCCVNALEALNVVLEWQPSDWIFNNLEYLQKLLDSCIRSHNQDIQEALQNVLALVIKAVTQQSNVESAGDEKKEKSKAFMNYLVGIVTEDLSSNNSVAAGVTLSWTITQFQPELLDLNLPLIIRTFGKLVKDHIALSMSMKGQNANETLQSAEEAKITSKLLETILHLCALRISVLGDQRRIYLSLMVQLIDRSNDKKLLTKIAEIVSGWVFAKDEIIPTTKEKAGVLSKMMMYEMKNDPELTNMYYKIIVDIFKADSLSYSELTFRLEHPFLVGTKISDTTIRQELMNILSNSIDKDIRNRLFYVIREQNWEYLSEYPWLNQASQILYKSFDFEHQLVLKPTESQLAPLSLIGKLQPKTQPNPVSEGIVSILSEHKQFVQDHLVVQAKHVLEPLLDLSYQSPDAIHNSWCNLFPVAYNAISQREKQDFLHSFVVLLSRDYHMRQQESVPNVIHIMLSASSKCPDLQLPPHLVKYLGLNYDAWYPGIKILEQIDQNPIAENSKIKEANKDALVEMYAGLQEDDMFYGLWRRRSKYVETNAALSYEQIGLWDKAQKMYEAAQIKARSGVLPYSESEYALWEDDWILCAEKLQYWDVLTELAKHEGFTDLLLECGWRIADWIKDKEPLRQSVETVMDVPTPRRQMFQTFLTLQSYSQNQESVQNVQRLIDEGIQLSLKKWWKLPQKITGAHLSLFHGFQQYVEFSEAIQIYRSLSNTTAENLDTKSQDLKRVLQAWRERLPNNWDDINIWNDLVTWRKHAFDVINKYYLPLIPSFNQGNGNGNANQSHAYRGYHEIAWVINRFAHVAREHNMPEVCINQLAKIYTLPNIEIQEAFLKLREQAKCYYKNPAELNTGLDVISNTNLVYFAAQQKAEFITLKGMFLAKLNIVDEANSAFATAVQLDLNLPKAWAEWGFFNDSRFTSSGDINFAKHAISCYLQAASLYKNNKSRRLLCRILWLVGLDNSAGTLTESFLGHKGEMPVWHWVTFIPQLLSALANKEGKVAYEILFSIAKSYPQALHFQLRTSKEDYAVIQKQLLQQQQQQQQQQTQPTQGTATPNVSTDIGTPVGGTTAPPTPVPVNAQTNATIGTPVGGLETSGTPVNAPASATPAPVAGAASNLPAPNSSSSLIASPLLQRKPWAWIDDISRIMKSAFPLLTLSLESFVDQITQRFKINADADGYRLIVALYHDGVQQFNRLPNPRENNRLPPSTEASIERFAETVLPPHLKVSFNEDIIQSKPNLEMYITKLLKWKTCMEERLDKQYANKVNLERLCPHLSQFHHQKFEDIDIPGQYLLNKESNQGFIKIERFMPTIDLLRGPIACSKRITIRGTDGSYHKFAIQFPSARNCRREERMYQMFRLFNDRLSRNVQTRKRNIEFTIPNAIPLSPHIRMISDDEKIVNMYSVYEKCMKVKGSNKDEPLAFYIEKIKSAFDPRLPKPDLLHVKAEILSAIQTLFVPNNMMKEYFINYYPKFEDFWIFRKQFTSQYATFIVSTYMMCINNRQPHKIHIDQSSGKVFTSEMLPYKVAAGKSNGNNMMSNTSMDVSQQRAAPFFCTLETVPFRLTPNIQELIGSVGTEGILSMHMVLICQCLSETSYNIDHFLNLFVRDEVITWYTQRQKNVGMEIPHLSEIVKVNVDSINKKITAIANVDNNQTVSSQMAVNLIGHAVNPRNLANSESSWMPYF